MKGKQPKFFGIVFWSHLTIIALAYLSPFLFSLKWILPVALILFVQFVALKRCVLTTAQFGKDDDMTFFAPYLEMIGFNISRKQLANAMRFFMPFAVVAVVAIALLWQIWLEKEPLLF